MQLTVNGDLREVQNGVMLAEYLASCNLPSRMVVVEHNGTIVDRNQYNTMLLAPGDVLEIVQMMAGG